MDGGRWYTLKVEKIKQNIPTQASTGIPLLPYSGWGKFPSHGPQMPKHFNKGHIHHHIVESVQFLNEDTFDDDSDSDGDCDDDCDIEDLHTAKPMKKGLKYFTSGHVQKMQDSAKCGHYFLKSKVRASYTSEVYDVTVTLSQQSGFVRDASCTCRASAMGRCSHVTGLLYALVDYIDTCEAIKIDPQSCTSLPCAWNQGRKSNKQPKKVQESVYPSAKKRKIHDIINYDPRAPVTCCTDAEKQAGQLISSLQNHKHCMWLSLLTYNYKDYCLDIEHTSILKEQIQQFIQNLKVGSTSNFPVVELVKQQGSQGWFNERRVRLTASVCKDVVSLKSDSAKFNFLNRCLWKTEQISAPALQYGTKYEKVARESYRSLKNADRFMAVETGLWVSCDDPELACSPDGLIMDHDEPTIYGILEIKCPKSLENECVSHFDVKLSDQQKKSFFLEINDEIKIMLKRTHKYYYQVQMQMGVTGTKFCDFVVWSSKETLVIRIRFDEHFWADLKAKLIEFHHSYLCPEIFEMRIPRNLLPVKL